MNTLLMVNSSPRSNSISRKLTHRFAEDWTALHPNGQIVERDLSDGTIPYLSEPWIEAAYTPEAQRTPAQRELLALSDTLIDEILAADVILLGIPMHNFSVPASFKAWIDQIARAGKTFSYTRQGPEGPDSFEQEGSRDPVARRRVRARESAGSDGLPGFLPSPGAWSDRPY